MTPERLTSMDLFSDLEPRELQVLAAVMRERALAPGWILFDAGARAASCYFVLDGQIIVEAQVLGRGRQRLAVLERGDVFGEVAVLDGGRRSASCAAGDAGAVVAELGKPDFDQIFNAGNAFAYKLMDLIARRLVDRLRGATARLLQVIVEEG